MGNKISEKKFFSMLFLELFGMASLTYPAILVRLSGKNGLPVLLMASSGLFLLAFFFLWCSGAGGTSFQEKVTGFSPFWRNLTGGVYAGRYLIHSLFLMVLFLSLIREVLLPGQSRLFLLLPFLVLLYLTAGKKISVRGNILEILFPWIVVPFLIVLVLALLDLDYKSLALEVIVPGKMPEIGAAYGMLCFYQPVEFLLFLAPAREKVSGKKYSPVFFSCLFVAGIRILFYFAAVGMFGTVRTGENIWSALYVLQSVRLPGNFVERLDILFLIFWIFGIYALVSGYLFYSEQLFCEKRRKSYSFIFLLLLLLSAIPQMEPDRVLTWFLRYKMWIDVPLSILIPLTVSLTGKKRRAAGAAVCFLLLPFLMTGCQGRTDIEERNYVMAVGIEPGSEEKFLVGMESADISKSTESGGGVQKGRCIYLAGESLYEVEEKEKKQDEKKLDYGHVKALILSLRFTEEEGAWNQLLRELKEKRELAGTTLVFFTEESLSDYMEYFKEGETSLGEYLDRMVTNKRAEKRMEYTLSDLLRDQAEGRGFGTVPVLLLESSGIGISEKEWEDSGSGEAAFDDVLRFHIRAESDKEEDQEKKIRVKDRVLPYLRNIFSACKSKEEAMETAEANLSAIEKEVEKACRMEDMACGSSVYLTREAFPLKIYGSRIMPPGTYDALRIDLGKAEGKNWWCMLYPSLCYVDGVVENCGENDNMEETDADFSKEPAEFHIKWKIPEIIRGFFGKSNLEK